jgi:amino acid transporter
VESATIVPATPEEVGKGAFQEGVVAPKGLKGGAVGLLSSVGVGMASTAPAYSLAATLGFVVVIGGVQTPLIVILAFIPMFCAAWATKLMNRVDPDCGTSFTWAARALGPRTGWFAGGWATIASDFLAMGSYAQVAGQYVFFLVGAKSIGADPTSGWVLAVGIAWIVGLTYLCYRGIEISARIQVALVSIEVVLLLVMAVVALVKVTGGGAPAGHLTPTLSWFDPTKIPSFGAFMATMLLMVFIYWGWDTTTSINEESDEPHRIPGTAGVISTLLLLLTYLLVVMSVQSFAGLGSKGIGLGNPNNQNDVLSPLGSAIFGHSTVGQVLTRLLFFMVLTSAAATTQTTILPNARTMLSMAYHKSIAPIFGRTHRRYLTPTVSTISFGAASVVYYLVLNFISHGQVLGDAVTATTFFAALYLAITGLACAWRYRSELLSGVRSSVSKVLVPAFAAFALFAMIGWSFKTYWDPSQSYVDVHLPLVGLHVGATLLLVIVSALIGIAWMVYARFRHPGFFRGEMSRYALTDSDELVELQTTAPGPGGSSP